MTRERQEITVLRTISLARQRASLAHSQHHGEDGVREDRRFH